MQREDPSFKKDLLEVFSSFNRLLSLPETQLTSIHKIQVSIMRVSLGGVHGNIVTEGGAGVLPSHSSRASSDILP